MGPNILEQKLSEAIASSQLLRTCSISSASSILNGSNHHPYHADQGEHQLDCSSSKPPKLQGSF